MSDTASVLIKAANFAAIKHKDQRRKDPDQTPYINHPIGVANILTSVSIKNFKLSFVLAPKMLRLVLKKCHSLV